MELDLGGRMFWFKLWRMRGGVRNGWMERLTDRDGKRIL